MQVSPEEIDIFQQQSMKNSFRMLKRTFCNFNPQLSNDIWIDDEMSIQSESHLKFKSSVKQQTLLYLGENLFTLSCIGENPPISLQNVTLPDQFDHP
jgi:hypothetical protein